MAFIYPLKKSSEIRTLQDLQELFLKNLEKSLEGYEEGRIIFDEYLDMSLKNKTRMSRASTSADIEYLLHPGMRLTMSIRDLLSSSKTKRNLTIMFAKAVVEHFHSKPIRLYVIYDKQIVGPDVSEEHNHEEADTLIPHQVIATVKNNPLKDITVRSPDTDVFMLLLDLVSNDYLDNRTGLKLNLGKGKGRIIDVQERVRVLGKPRCRALVGFHNFTGADWGGKFVGKTKESWTKLFM